MKKLLALSLVFSSFLVSVAMAETKQLNAAEARKTKEAVLIAISNNSDLKCQRTSDYMNLFGTDAAANKAELQYLLYETAFATLLQDDAQPLVRMKSDRYDILIESSTDKKEINSITVNELKPVRKNNGDLQNTDIVTVDEVSGTMVCK